MTYSWQLDMVMHSSYFCLVTLLLRFTYFKETHALTFFSLLFIAAVTLELLQAWIPKRSSTLLDIMSNGIGILIALSVCFLAKNLVKKQEKLLKQKA